MDSRMQKLLAEGLGTFTLVFGGSMSIIAATRADQPLVIEVGLGFGLSLLAGLYAFGEISGGHFNPAVSLAMFVDRRLNAGDLVGYWIAQFAGGIAAALAVLAAFSRDDVAGTATIASATWDAFWIEMLFTAIFVLVILQATRTGKFASSALVAIPLTLVAIHLAAIPISGSSVNPARTFGPALVGGEWSDIWIYFVAPAAGAIAGAVVHAVVVKGETMRERMTARTA